MKPKTYYYSINGTTVSGPSSEGFIKESISNGLLPYDVQVYDESNLSWIPFSKISEAPSLLEHHTSPGWYYSTNQARSGPISTEQLAKLISQGAVKPDTLVWNPTMTSWTPARKSSLAPIFGPTVSPPPLKQGTNNIYIWMLAILPALFGGINITFPEIPEIPFAIALAISNITLCVLDIETLRKAGYKTSWMIAWGVLCMPLYFIVRVARVKSAGMETLIFFILLGILILVG